jgi:tetratricopeptide (TPR) repeat protein
LFRLLALTVPPVLLLGACEAALRAARYGYATDFFRPSLIRGQKVFIENDRFALRFFPPQLARTPEPLVMPALKPAGTLRIFVLGESAALGDPEPAYGAGRYLEVLLGERFPSEKFEVVNVAMTAINSHAILPIARECARHQGDLWIVYMGNNEMVGPFGAVTVFGAQTPPLALIRLNLALQTTCLGQLLTALGRKLKPNPATPSSWGGMEMFLRNKISPSNPHKRTAYHHFQQNLRDILRAGLESGARIVLSTVAVNLRDCPPFASAADSGLPQGRRETFEQLCAEGNRTEEQGLWVQTVGRYEQAAALDPRFAELQFRWGACLLHLAHTSSASEHLQLACDNDALPFRADSVINDIIRQEARRGASGSLVLCDAANALAAESAAGICGQESFYEHVHFSFDGNYRLACAWAAQVERLLPEPIKAAAAPGWASQGLCERRLGLTDWNRCNVIDEVLRRLGHPPLSGQSNNRARSEALWSWQSTLRKKMDGAAASQAREVYQQALNRAPDDHYLHEAFADFLEAAGDYPRAMAEWERVHQLIPHDYLAVFRFGKLQALQGQRAAAESSLRQALAMHPDLSEAWYDLGEIHMLEGRPELALEDYREALALQPTDARCYAHRALALSRLNRPAEAILAYREAVRLDPGFWEAHFELGLLLGLQNDLAGAASEFGQVVRLKPDFAAAHANLGVALFKEGQLVEARAQFEETLRIEPGNKSAMAYLAQLQPGARMSPTTPP